MAEVPKVHIEFADGEDKISLEGPPEEVTVAQKQLEATIAELKRTMDFAEVSVNKKVSMMSLYLSQSANGSISFLEHKYLMSSASFWYALN